MSDATRRVTRNRAAGFLAACALAVVLAACGEQHATSGPDADRPVEVHVATAAAVSQAGLIRVAGVVRPATRAQLSTRQAGTVEAVLVVAGERVAIGQELLRIDARDLLAARSAAASQRDAAREALAQAVRNRDRFARLYQQDLVAKVRFEEAELQAEQAAGRLEQAEAELAAVEMNLEYTRLRAPFAGVVSEIITEEGAFASPGRPLLMLEDRTRLEVEAGVQQDGIAALETGTRLSIRVHGIAEPIAGRVQALLPALGQNGAGMRLRMEIEAPPAGLMPGMIAEVLLPSPRGAAAVVSIPAEALLRRGQLSGVFVVAEDAEGAQRARLRWVTLDEAASDDATARVRRGLRPGEQVVVGSVVSGLADDQVVVPRN